MTLVNLRQLSGSFHSFAKHASFETPFLRIPGRFWSDWGRILEAKMEIKVDFGKILFGCVLASISDAFLIKKAIVWNHHHQETRISALQFAKSGGKMIDNEEMYSQEVLRKDTPRPVLVFFSAPW